jgi:glycosyltransferase involved in cell wall biosynthesis
MEVSVVIPTCNRRERLLSLLRDLGRSTHPIVELVIVDSSDQTLDPADYADFTNNFPIQYIASNRKSVCVQRNLGIHRARGPWILLCDDDMEVPANYLEKLAQHVHTHPEAGAVSGLWLEKSGKGWQSGYPVTTSLELVWRYVFQLSIWGEIRVSGPLIDLIAKRYRRLGNHISRAGWPVIVDLSGQYFRTPIYSLGASLVRKEWLLESPYDERLDPHGYGDNYGVAVGFPAEAIHVVTGVAVRHHRSQANRLAESEAYARRLLALHYFVASRKGQALAHVQAPFFIWSLVGQVVFHTSTGNLPFAWAAWNTLLTIVSRRNPHLSHTTAAGIERLGKRA